MSEGSGRRAGRARGEVDRSAPVLAYPTTVLHYVGGPDKPAFQNGWGNYGQTTLRLAYYKNAEGVVRFQGCVKDGTAGSVVFVLPVGFRPAGQCVFTLYNTGTTVAYCIVRANGEVVITPYGTNPVGNPYMDVVFFLAAA